jgi:glycosyltransferase involved in cell wall biosynthesis
VSDGDLSLSVTIASYNRRERLLEVLRAMGGQSYPAERYDVVVVLDGSTDGSAGAVRALDVPYRLRVVEQENRGLAAGRNRGGAEAEAPVVVFLDDDIVPEPAFVAEHAQGHRDTGGRRIVLGSYPPAERDDEDLLSLQIRRSWADYFRRRSEPGHQWTYVDFADGNVSFPRELIGKAGGWDETFVPGRVRRQDWEYGIRLLQAGVRFVDRPAARGTHYFDTSFDTAVRNRRVEGRSDIVIGTKHPQIRSHLYAARILRTAAGRRAPDAYLSLAFERPRAVERAIAAGMPVVRILERGGLQASWWALAGRLMSAAYVLGVKDALGSLARFREFMAPALDAERLPRLRVELEETGAVEMPADAGTVELVVARGGAEVARVEAPEPESQWDWQRLAERVAEAAPPRAVAPEELLDTMPGTVAPS